MLSFVNLFKHFQASFRTLASEPKQRINNSTSYTFFDKHSTNECWPSFVGPQGRNFLSYELDENGTLKCKTSFGCQSDWVDLLRYTRKLAANLEYRNDKVIVLKNGTKVKPLPTLQKALYNHCINNPLTKANDLSIQGSFFTLQNINRKCSNSFLFNWNINDDLYIFVVKARMSLFPTNFTLYLWDRQKTRVVHLVACIQKAWLMF